MSTADDDRRSTSRRGTDRLMEWRVSELEKAHAPLRAALAEIQVKLENISRTQEDLVRLWRELAKLRDRMEEEDGSLLEKINKVDNKLTTERGRINSMSRPLWYMLATVLAAAITLIWKSGGPSGG